jgi:hypothetical protein
MNRRKAKAVTVDLKLFEDFYDAIARLEDHLCRYGHIGWSPRSYDLWERPIDAYEAIAGSLRKVSNRRLFPVPTQIPFLRPIVADNAHQAQLFLMNPPEHLFGFVGVLRSEQYVEIKAAAQRELETLFGAVDPVAQNGSHHAVDPETRIDAVLLRHHFKNENPEPLTQEQIALRAGVSQSAVSKSFRKRPGRWNGYARYGFEGPRRGFNHGDGNVDVIVDADEVD